MHRYSLQFIRRSTRGYLLGMLVTIAACSGVDSPVAPDLPLVNSPDVGTSVLIPPDWNRLEEIGCTALGDSAVVGAIGLPVSPTRFDRFDCRSVSLDSVMLAVVTIASDAAGTNGSAAAMSYGYWFLVDMWDDCSGTGGGDGYWSEDGTYVLPDIGVSCTRYYKYQWVSEGGGDGGGGDTPPPQGGGGEGGPPPPPPPSPPPICPSSDPACLRPFTLGEMATLQAMLGSVFEPESTITDSTALQVCQATKAALSSSISEFLLGDPGSLFLGTSDPEPPDYPTPHMAESYHGKIHIDPGLWAAATTAGPNRTSYQRAMVLLVLHEFRHLPPWNDKHPHADAYQVAHGTPTSPAGTAALYANDFPFNFLHSQQSGDMCVKPY